MTNNKRSNEGGSNTSGSGRSITPKKSDVPADRGVKKTQQVAADAAKTAKDALSSGASELAEQTRETAEQTAATVGDAVDRVSNSLREVATSLEDGSIHERTFGQLAQGLADVSDAIRDQDIRELSNSVSGFARRNPLLFAGAAALLGFSLARMVSRDRDGS